EAHNSNISKNVTSKRKREPELLQEDTNKHFSTLTKIIINNSKCSKEDAIVISQHNTKGTISPLKDKKSLIKSKQEDIIAFNGHLPEIRQRIPENYNCCQKQSKAYLVYYSLELIQRS
ncbi:29421_t:CDS:1, partial [Gigaspora margarita]